MNWTSYMLLDMKVLHNLFSLFILIFNNNNNNNNNGLLSEYPHSGSSADKN